MLIKNRLIGQIWLAWAWATLRLTRHLINKYGQPNQVDAEIQSTPADTPFTCLERGKCFVCCLVCQDFPPELPQMVGISQTAYFYF
ncbi:hypothetical protein XELAEV_18032386mg [Xenopus laevis]|uniref:Secreted protein n=1 Tax=Xenopus laevis TaxID=8355 RepID=A0A974HH00_XENLA|nr:hypothetical protein XELAEV_18032386mg [Xenopus laevis]